MWTKFVRKCYRQMHKVFKIKRLDVILVSNSCAELRYVTKICLVKSVTLSMQFISDFVTPASMMHKNPQRCKIIHGMHPAGGKERS